MKFAVESWAPEYGVSADESQLVETAGAVDPAIEVPPAAWEPISPPAATARPASVLFVDGVRRIDARVWFDDGQLTRAGVCASVAAGSVITDHAEARVNELVVVRGMFARSSPAAGPIVTAHGTYRYFPCASDAPDDIYLGIHEQMTAVESHIAEQHDAELVVYDGPLRHRIDPRSVGYVKTQHVQYLPDELHALLGRLAPGQRTPLFLIGGRGTRYSWYLRLPGPVAQPMSGIVRCELPGAGTVQHAVERADMITGTLPRFASEPHKDSRAPQNLYPIAGLERQLRHRLGDPQLMERALRRAAGAS
ncbi:MAG: DNA double-strand break repair nuclease NurA [Actinomycetota bacterium]|nr:DNA double-strand break repair nuclease NurA [Actinomycetota bacterium]